MGSIEITGMDELLKKLEKLSNQGKVEQAAIKAVNAAQPLNEAAMRTAVASVEHGPYATGSVSGSVSSTSAKVNSYGVFSVARPTGRDKNGARNAEKAAYLQYGTPKMAARPWRQKAVNSAEKPCMKVMEEIWKTEMELD